MTYVRAVLRRLFGPQETVAEDNPAPPGDPAAPWRGPISQIQSTAKWLIGAFAAVGTVLVAGSQLADLGAVEDSDRLVLAFVAVGLSVSGIGIAVWSLGSVIAPQPPVSTGDLVRLAAKRGLFGRMLATSPELLQEQASSVEELHRKLIQARRDRNAAKAAFAAAPKDPATGAHFAACDRTVQDLRTVAAQLRPIGAYSAARDAFDRARIVAFLGAGLVAAGAAIFAYAAHPPAPAPAAASALDPVPSRAVVRLTDDGRRRLAPAIGTGCTGDLPVLVLSGSPDAYDVVLVAERCRPARFRLTPTVGTVTATDTALPD